MSGGSLAPNILKQSYSGLYKVLLEPSLLSSEVALGNAISVLESHIEGSFASAEASVKDLARLPVLLAYAICAIGPNAFNNLLGWVDNCFPTDTKAFLVSTQQQLLDRLSTFLLHLRLPDSSGDQQNLDDSRRYIQMALPILETLAYTLLPSEAEVQQRTSRWRASTTLDPKPFCALGIATPATREQAYELSRTIIEQQKSILQRYFRMLRDPHSKEMLKKAYLCEVASRTSKQISSRLDAVTQSSTAGALPGSTPSVYKMLQSMPGSLYFESASGLGPWRILMSTRADSDLRHARRHDWTQFNAVFKTIRDLSKGRFSDANHEQITGAHLDSPIYQAITGGRHLVYHFSSVNEFGSKTDQQAIKIFGVHEHEEMKPQFWDAVASHLDGIHGPAQAISGLHEVSCMASSPGLSESPKNDLFKLHEILVLEKYVIFSQAFLNSILADQLVAHVFNVSEEEREIIEHPLSCYVIGRSGTGKTTTMMFKMLKIERAWKMYEGTMPKPRQIFATQSSFLAEKVKEYYGKLSESMNVADKVPQEIKAMFSANRRQQTRGLVDLDEELVWRDDAHKCFSELRDEDFPLFVTFDQLFRLLEADLSGDGSPVRPRNQSHTYQALSSTHARHDTQMVSNDYMQQRRTAFVSFNVFQESYWPYFPRSLTNELNPAVVFGEFMGVIEGSEDTLNSAGGYLSKDTYICLSHRTHATFADNRDIIYQLFEAYLKRKRARGEYDVADRTHKVLGALREKGVPGQALDFLYIDEAQDNRLIDALVLRMICADPAKGLFVAGDTAQAISIGSSFRFQELKAFLYRMEENGSSASPHVHPRSFQLAKNYRSHAGIVDCAHTVIGLITRFWPYAIDSLPKEEGKIKGIKPIFYTRWDPTSVTYEKFFFGSSAETIEFGAQQCILVRDDAARERLRKAVKFRDIGLILTLYESKGLEFNDVLLFDFFADSTVDAENWQLVLDTLSQPCEEDRAFAPVTDARYNALCRDLKFLYVAITRARKNLWIVDTSDVGEPIRVLWTAKAQIETAIPKINKSGLAESSRKEEWEKRALDLFNNKQYLQAMQSYERASRPREKNVAHAYHLREVARATPLHSRDGGQTRQIAFTGAAEAFWSSARCQGASAEEQLAYYRIAAECYTMCGNYGKAGEAYCCASQYALSAQSYRRGGMFDEAVEVIRSHRNSIDENIAKSILDVSRLEYFRTNRLEQGLELFDNEGADAALEFLDDLGLDHARFTVLKSLKRSAEAAEILLLQGRIMDAIDTFMEDESNPTAIFRASQCLLDELGRGLSLGISTSPAVSAANSSLQELIPRLQRMNLDMLDDDHTREKLNMFRGLAGGDQDVLLKLSESLFHRHHDAPSALLCLDHIYTCPVELEVASLLEITSNLRKFLLYVRLLQRYFFVARPCRNEDIVRLFTIEHSSEDLFLVTKESILYARCIEHPTGIVRTTNGGVIVKERPLDELIKRELRDRLHERVEREDESLYRARVLYPCFSFVASGRCLRQNCRSEHTDAELLTVETYNLRIRLVLQQIIILQMANAVEDRKKQRQRRGHWLRILYDTVNPSHYKLGSIHHFRPETIPEFAEALVIVRFWIGEYLHFLNPRDLKNPGQSSYFPEFLPSFMRAASLLFIFDTPERRNHLHRFRCVTGFSPYPLFRLIAHQKWVYVVHDLLEFMMNNKADSVTRGARFVCHIIERSIPIDLRILCDVSDLLCGRLLVHRERRSLHDIMLPRSWLLRLMDNLSISGSQSLSIMQDYINRMATLLVQVQTGHNAGYLRFENSDISRMNWQIKSVFVARICQNICLLAYNSMLSRMRSQVFKIVTSLRRHNRKPDQLYSPYATAETWDQLTRAICLNTATGSVLDEMIHIQKVGKTGFPTLRLPNVRRIVYNTLGEIPALLRTGVASLPKVTWDADVLPRNPVVEGETGGQDLAFNVEEDNVEEDNVEEDNEDIVNLEQEQHDAAPRALTEVELAAAATILSAYRRYRQRRARRDKYLSMPHSANIGRVAALFQEAAHTMQWARRRYRMLFLGSLPYLVVYLECVENYLRGRKDKAKKRLATAQHEDLEAAQDYLTKISRWIKEAAHLHKLLLPKSEFHREGDLEGLEARAREVQQLADQLPPDTAAKWREDLEFALKYILKPRVADRTRKKPALNVEDIDPLEVF